MPAPVGHGVQGHTCPILKRVALQTRYIDSGSKVAIAHGERGERGIGHLSHRTGSEDGVVAFNNSVTVDRGRHVVNCISKFLHFERGPDERPYALGIVVADGFGDVILERSVAPFVLLDIGRRLQHLGTDTRA